jgi:hypothetical protein
MRKMPEQELCRHSLSALCACVLRECVEVWIGLRYSTIITVNQELWVEVFVRRTLNRDTTGR